MAAIFKKANTAVITGGASGIGLAVAKKCAGYGMRVVVADWNAQGLDAAKSDLGPGALAVQMDVSKLEDWSRLRDVVSTEFGGELIFNFICLLFVVLSFDLFFFFSFSLSLPLFWHLYRDLRGGSVE